MERIRRADSVVREQANCKDCASIRSVIGNSVQLKIAKFTATSEAQRTMSEGLRFVAAYGWFLVLCALSTLYLQSQPGDVDACGDPQKLILECFKDFPQKLLQVDKIAITKEDLSGKCE